MIFLGQPNAFAYAALALWALFAVVAFASAKPPLATALTLIGGRLFLPESVDFKLPVLPDLDKYSIPALAAFIGCLFTARRQLVAKGLRPRPIDRWFLVLLAGHIGTMLTNGDVLQAEEPLPALTFYDLLTSVFADVVLVYLVFVCARAMFGSARGLRTLLLATATLALIYTPLCLYERVMGPNLNFKVFGFYQHDIVQTLRDDGFRPMVFVSHGIVLGRFLLVAMIGTAVLVRARAVSKLFILPLVYLSWVLLIGKSIGAIVLGLAALPLVLFTSEKVQARAAAALGVLVLLYPLLRGADVFPTDTLLEWAEAYSENRAKSLGARFEQEDMLLEKARERLPFGWGVYARSHVYDPETGEDISVTDGEWIIMLGSRGLIGFLGWYALYLVPTFAAWRHLRRMRMPQHRKLVAGAALINALLAVDTLPNAAGTLPHMLWAGALYGATYGVLRQDRLMRLRAAWQQRMRRAQDGAEGSPQPNPTPLEAFVLEHAKATAAAPPRERG